MFIIIERTIFIEAVQKTSRFTQKNTATLPVLSCILIVAGNDGIKFRSTNLETGIDFKVDGVNKTSGVAAIPANILQQIAATLTGEGSVTIEQSGETAVISFAGARSVVKTIPYEDFPTIPVPSSEKEKVTIKGSVLKSIIESVAVCASPSTIRQDLASIYLSFEGGTLVAAATDSFRLAEKKQPISTTIPNFSVLIPVKNSAVILQTLPDENVSFIVDEHQIAFLWNGSTLTTRLTSGVYPDYKQIIPKNTAAEATLLRKDFEAALRHTAIFSDAFQKIKLSLDPKKENITLTTHNTDLGSATESLHAKISGDAIEQSFNYRYLQTPLTLLNTESITLSASGVGQPLIIKGVGDNTFLYLVMPMNQ